MSINHDGAFNAKEGHMGKEKFLETKALKVYSRTRARRNPNSVVKLERKKILKTRTRALMGINF